MKPVTIEKYLCILFVICFCNLICFCYVLGISHQICQHLNLLLFLLLMHWGFQNGFYCHCSCNHTNFRSLNVSPSKLVQISQSDSTKPLCTTTTTPHEANSLKTLQDHKRLPWVNLISCRGQVALAKRFLTDQCSWVCSTNTFFTDTPKP